MKAQVTETVTITQAKIALEQTAQLYFQRRPDGAYAIDKAGERKLRNRLETFRAVTGTRCAVHLVMVTPEGVLPNAHSGVVQAEVVLDDLFADA